MAIPLAYNLRNLAVRRTSTAMTLLGIGLAATIFLTVKALQLGMEQVNRRTGTVRDVLVLRKGPDAETQSAVDLESVAKLRALAGIAKDSTGAPLLSAELIAAFNQPRRGGAGTSNVSVRGIQPQGAKLRDGFRIVAGRMFKPGLREIVVARNIADRFEGLALGDKFVTGNKTFEVVGIFEAPGTAYESEIWGDFDIVREDFHRTDPSSVLLRAEDEATATRLAKQINETPDLALNAMLLPEYFGKQAEKGSMVLGFAQFLAYVLGIGAVFAAANTMYAAISQRGAEIGVLRAIGFRKGSVLVSFLFESILLGLGGGIFGVLATAAIAATGFRTGTTNWTTFTEQTFSIGMSPAIAVAGLVFGLLVGALGGLIPAITAARRPILQSLRQL